MNLTRLAAVIAKEWAEITRDRLFLGLAFVVPPVLMLVFGLGMNLDVENIPFVIVDHDHTPRSSEYTYRMIDSRYFDFKGYSMTNTRFRAFSVVGRCAQLSSFQINLKRIWLQGTP